MYDATGRTVAPTRMYGFGSGERRIGTLTRWPKRLNLERHAIAPMGVPSLHATKRDSSSHFDGHP